MSRVSLVVLFACAVFGAALGFATAPPLWALALAALLAGGGAAFARLPASRGLGLVGAVVACAAFVARVHHERLQVALPDGVVVVDGVVRDVAFADEGVRAVVDVDAVIADDGAAAAVALRVDVAVVNAVVAPGDRVRVRARIHEPTPALSPGTFDGEAYALSRGLHGHMSVSEPRDVVVLAHGAPPFFAAVRAALRERLLQQRTPREAGLLLALLIGDTSLFEPEQEEAYRHVGAGHLLAVSGLQVTLLAVLLARLASVAVALSPLGRRGRGGGIAAATALAGVWAFVFLCGCPPSAVRAGLMASAVVLARARGRRTTLADAIAAAGLLTVMASPTAVLDAGFLLSYVAVLGLVASTAPASTSTTSLWGRARPAIVSSLVAGVATLPISAWLFGAVAPAGLLANIVLVPVASALQLPALVGGVVGAVVDVSLFSYVGAEAALLLEALVFGFASVLPGIVDVAAPSSAVAAALTLLALVVGAWLVRGQRSRAVAGLVAVAVVLGVSHHEPKGMRVTFLPVGQGDSVVVELPDGTVYVVDGGGRVAYGSDVDERGRAAALAAPGERVILPYLRRRGIEQVDVMVLSHPHPDHAGGLHAVAAAMPVRQFWWAGSREGALVRPLLARAGTVRSTPALIGRFRHDEVTVEVLAPAPAERTPTYPELSANDNSLVLRFCLHGGCVLLPGDVEHFGEEYLVATNPGDRLRAAVVKAPHHGSSTSSSDALVAATDARHVVMCTGRHNTFGFPNPAIVERWRNAGAQVWNTAEHGEVSFFVDGADVVVAPYRAEPLRHTAERR